jgi:hypothetical protein
MTSDGSCEGKFEGSGEGDSDGMEFGVAEETELGAKEAKLSA